MSLPSVPSDLVSREFLRIGGGYGVEQEGNSPAGGLDIDDAGNLATDGDVTIKGVISAGETPQTLTDVNGDIDGAKIQAGTVDTSELADDAVDATKLDETGNYTIAGLDITGNKLDYGVVTQYVNSIEVSTSWEEICEIDMGSAASWSRVGILIDVWAHSPLSARGHVSAYFGFYKTTSNYYRHWTYWGPKGEFEIKLRDMGSDVYQIWLRGTANVNGVVEAKYYEPVDGLADFTGFGASASGGSSDIAQDVDYEFGDNVSIAGDLGVDGGAIEAGTDGGARGVLTAWDGSGGNAPGCVKLCSPNGTPWYVFVEDDGTVKVHNALPTQNSDGSEVGTQT